MAIVKMNKFTLYAFESQKEILLKELQKFEGVQFTNLQENLDDEEVSFLNTASDEELIMDNETQLSKIKFALDFLGKYVEKESGLKSLIEGKKAISFDELENKMKNNDWLIVYQDLKAKEEKLISQSNEISKLETEIETLKPWRNFDAPFNSIKNSSLLSYNLGSIPNEFKDRFYKEIDEKVPFSYIEVINQGKKEEYVLIVALKEQEASLAEIIKNNSFSKAYFDFDDTPDNGIKANEAKIKLIREEKMEVEKELVALSGKIIQFQEAYEYFANKLARLKACSNFLKSDSIVAIQGWNTYESNGMLEKTVEKAVNGSYFLEFKEVEEEDIVPVKLKNNKLAEPLESVVEMYSLPNYRETDPTFVISLFYICFFGMMLSDAAYGVILTIATFIALKFFNLEKGMRSFIKLFFYCGISTIFWGAIYGGWFGDAPAKFLGMKITPLIDPASDIMLVLGIAVVMGVIHIFMGLGIKAYNLIKNGQILDAVYDVLLWYIALIGLGLWIAGVGAPVGKIMAIVGIVGLLFTQGRDADTIAGKIGSGIYGVYGITSYVGDVVSYSRLLALGLATGFIGNAFNLMITLIPAGPLRWIFGTILFIGGHLFNLGINALGAYVHSSRLQYLEFFNKFYEGGGRPFRPLKSESKFINVVNK